MKKSTSTGNEQSSQLTSNCNCTSNSVRQRAVGVDDKSTYCIEDRQQLLVSRPRAQSAQYPSGNSSRQQSAIRRVYSFTIEWPIGLLFGTLGYVPVFGPLFRRSMQLCTGNGANPRDKTDKTNANGSLRRKALQYDSVPTRHPGDTHYPYEPPAPPVEHPVDFLLNVPCRTLLFSLCTLREYVFVGTAHYL